MKHLMILLSVLLSSATLAETVKVVSRYETSVNNGSGWLVETPMGPMVVTCPHVLIPKGTTEIFLENTKNSISTREVWSDWARGISLLKLDSPPPKRIDDRFDSTESLANASASRGDALLVEGFPSAQTQEAYHGGGQVALARTTQPFLPLAEGLEIEKTHVERGMSCGPVYKKSNHQLIGILSNHIPMVIMNQDTLYMPIASDKIYQNVFAVSAGEIAKAFNKYVQVGPNSGEFELLSMPDDDRMIVGFGSFRFSFTKGKDGSFKVAGGTGGGVGGTESVNAGSIQVTLNPTAKEKPTPAHLTPYFDSWKKVLYAGRPVILDGFVKVDGEQNYSRKNFATIEEFARYLMQPDMIPFGRINRDFAQTAEVQKKATDLKQFVTDMKCNCAKKLFNSLFSTSAILAEDYGVAIVKTDELRAIADPAGRFRAEWIQIFNDSDVSPKAYPLMVKLQELIQSLQIKGSL